MRSYSWDVILTDKLLKALRDKGVFRRNKVSLKKKLRACILYMA